MTSRYRTRCSISQAVDQRTIAAYTPKCCPTPPNTDPRRISHPYCPPVISRSEPLSHAEYLRRLKANNTAALSSPASLVQYGEGPYRKTIWTETASTGNCCNNTGKALPAVPSVHPERQSALDAGHLTEMKGAYAARGDVSVQDLTNRTEEIHTLKQKGLTIAADSSFQAPAGGKRETCESCGFSGTNTETRSCTC